MKRLGLGIIVALGLTLPAFGQGVSNLPSGSWKLNLEKSAFINSQPPKSLITTWGGEGQNFIATSESVDTQGQPFKMVVTQIFDGQPHPTTGVPLFDSTSLTRIGNTTNIVRFKNGGGCHSCCGKRHTLGSFELPHAKAGDAKQER
jgi:hypothetical protein